MSMLMKGHALTEAARSKLAFPCHVEVKVDEIRCRVRKVYCAVAGCDVVLFESYAGNPLHNLGRLYSQMFLSYFDSSIYQELDIGIEVNGNFNDSYRWVRSSTGIPKKKLDKKTGVVAPALDASMVKFILFDLPTSGLAFVDRLRFRRTQDITLRRHGLPFSVPNGRTAYSLEDIDTAYLQARLSGKEGIMVKTLGHLYKRGKGTGDWWKVKPSETFDGYVIAITQAVSEDGTPLQRAGSITVRLADGSTASPAGIDHDLARMIWADGCAYMGKWVEFNAMERDRKGGYRHPVFIRFREAK